MWSDHSKMSDECVRSIEVGDSDWVYDGFVSSVRCSQWTNFSDSYDIFNHCFFNKRQ